VLTCACAASAGKLSRTIADTRLHPRVQAWLAPSASSPPARPRPSNTGRGGRCISAATSAAQLRIIQRLPNVECGKESSAPGEGIEARLWQPWPICSTTPLARRGSAAGRCRWIGCLLGRGVWLRMIVVHRKSQCRIPASPFRLPGIGRKSP
jgi:hypothetical protein